MADAARAGARLRHGLPEEILVWEILVRLPPKTLLRCRGVCRAWRGATSTREFLLEHHAHQPALPLLYGDDGESVDFIPFDHREGLPPAERLQSVARLGDIPFNLWVEASCDGLIVVSICNVRFALCNLATRQHAPLQMLSGFLISGMYPDPLTGEYRLLMFQNQAQAPIIQDGCYVFALGSGQQPRHIEFEGPVGLMSDIHVLFRGCLHWYGLQNGGGSNRILVFDTTTELFRQMRPPVVPRHAELFEMDGMLCMSCFNDVMAPTIIDIWMLQNYESEVWTFKQQIELPVSEIKARCESQDGNWNVMVVPGDGNLLVLVKFAEWLVHVDMDGKVVDTFHRKEVAPTRFQLKQTLVPHTFFPTLEGYVVNNLPFI